MLKFMLVMMVFTRTMFVEDHQVPTNEVVVEGSASATSSRRSRRRNGSAANTRATEQPADAEQPVRPAADQLEEPAIEQPAIEPPVDPPKRRGPSLNDNAKKILRNLGVGSKIPLTLHKNTKSFVGESATLFATEIRIVIRNFCPMEYHKWDLVPNDMKTIMYVKLEGKFQLLRNDKVFMAYVDSRLQAQWKRTRGVLSQHWKDNRGTTDPLWARSQMRPDCRSLEDWHHLCKYWELEKTRNYSDKMAANRGKQVMISRGGSRSIANHAYKMKNPETEMPPSPLQMWYMMHFKAEKEELQNEHTRLQYQSIIEHKKAAMNKINSEGTTIDAAMEHKLEDEAIKSVCGRQKTLQSGWEIGVGPVFRKKDYWMKLTAESSQQNSSETTEDVKNEVTELKEKLKQSNEKQEIMAELLITKFPEFENKLSTTFASDEAYVSNESSNDCDN